MRRAFIATEKAMESHRLNAHENWREWWGRYYPHKNNDQKKRHFNLINRAVNVLLGSLCRRAHASDVETDDPALEGEAAMLSLFLDRLGDRLNRKRLSREILLDALLGPRGVVRCGEKVSGELVTIDGRQYDRGAPFAKRVSFDHYGIDQARHRDEVKFEYEVMNVSRTGLLESGLFNPAVLERLPSTRDRRPMAQRRLMDERAGGLSDYERNELVDEVEVVEFALYADSGTVMIMLPACEGWDTDYLRVVEHDGPDRGPFRSLELMPANDQVIGVAPVSIWREQADAFYVFTNKLVEQAEKSKTIIAARQSVTEDDLDTIRDADDHDVVYTDAPEGIQTYQFGEVNKDLMILMSSCQDWFNQQSGGTDVLGGGDGSTDKATIYAGMQQQASATLGDLADTHEEFESGITADLAFYGTADPLLKLPMTYRAPGGETFRVTYDASQRRGDYNAYRFRVVPRSAQVLDPNVMSARLMQLIQTVLQAAQVSAATGGYINVQGVAKLTGRELGIAHLERILNDPAILQQAAMESMMMPGPDRGMVGGGGGPGMGMGGGMGMRGMGGGGGMTPGLPPGAMGGMRGGMVSGGRNNFGRGGGGGGAQSNQNRPGAASRPGQPVQRPQRRIA